MRGSVCCTIYAVLVCWMLIDCEGRIDLGLCPDLSETCQCGNPEAGIQVQIPIRQCTYTRRWKFSCKACDEYDKAALCSQFRHCLSCNARKDGKCSACPVGRYGDSCQGVCRCQNNGRCKKDGSCECPRGYTGVRCEQRQVATCSAAPSLAHGQITGGSGGSAPQGTVVSYTCNQGYVLVGPQRKRCQESGTWSGGQPRCEYSCSTPTPGPNLQVNVQEQRTAATPDNPKGVALVRIVNFACATGYTLQGAAQLNCLASSHWNAAVPTCVRSCGQPPNLRNGRQEGTTFGEGGVVRYFCDDGWTLSGDLSLICRNGQWTGTAPTCSQVTCTKPAISHSVLAPNSDTYAVGTVVSVSCSSGFWLDGASSITCQNNGAWSTSLPRCRVVTTTPAQITCPTLNAPDNGDVTAPGTSGVFQPGESIEFSCNQGFLLSGTSRLICQADGTWTGDSARCIRVITCADPGTPVDAIRKVEQPDVGRGGRGRFRGRLGSRGSRRRNSVIAGRNGDPAGTVVDIIPPGRFRALTRITFECKTRFYQLIGPQHRECQSNGQWSGRQPTCIPVCGKSGGARAAVIHNGEVSRLGEWPWQASIAQRQEDGTFYGVCGGTLVAENWIVTAAHCVTNTSTANVLPLRNMKIYLGMHYRNFQRHDSEVHVFDVSEIHVHPRYDPNILDSDIAMIRLFQPATFTDRVSPACLASIGNDGASFLDRLSEPGLNVTVTGWGETENNTDASVLMKTQLGIISTRSCEDKYAQSGFPLVVTSKMFCAGHDDGRSDTCFGDSGGPAVVPSGTGENRKWYLVGVVSWGSPLGCGRQLQYSGFTKVSRFLSFVNQFTGI